jgi:hypothetical protein
MRYLKQPVKIPEYRMGRSHLDFVCRMRDYWNHYNIDTPPSLGAPRPSSLPHTLSPSSPLSTTITISTSTSSSMNDRDKDDPEHLFLATQRALNDWFDVNASMTLDDVMNLVTALPPPSQRLELTRVLDINTIVQEAELTAAMSVKTESLGVSSSP